MNDEEIDNLIHQMIFGIPKDDNKSIISAYGSIDMDNLMATIRRLKKVPDINDLMKENKKLTNNWNELEEIVESRLMSIPDDICTNEVEETRRTTKIAVYQVILGKMEEIKDGNNAN